MLEKGDETKLEINIYIYIYIHDFSGSIREMSREEKSQLLKLVESRGDPTANHRGSFQPSKTFCVEKLKTNPKSRKVFVLGHLSFAYLFLTQKKGFWTTEDVFFW